MQRVDSREYSEWIAEFSLMPWGCDLAALGHKSKVSQSSEEMANLLMTAGNQNAAIEAERARRSGNSSR